MGGIIKTLGLATTDLLSNIDVNHRSYDKIKGNLENILTTFQGMHKDSITKGIRKQK